MMQFKFKFSKARLNGIEELEGFVIVEWWYSTKDSFVNKALLLYSYKARYPHIVTYTQPIAVFKLDEEAFAEEFNTFHELILSNGCSSCGIQAEPDDFYLPSFWGANPHSTIREAFWAHWAGKENRKDQDWIPDLFSKYTFLCDSCRHEKTFKESLNEGSNGIHN